jgi:hypothetical protein
MARQLLKKAVMMRKKTQILARKLRLISRHDKTGFAAACASSTVSMGQR